MPLLPDAFRDLVYAARVLSKHRGYAVASVLTLALGIGVTTTMFSLVRGVLLKPLPYPHPERLIRMFESSQRFPRFPVSPLNYLDYRSENRTLDQLAAYTRDDLQLSGAYSPERLSSLRVSRNYFETLGFSPAIGRLFEQTEMTGSSRMVILSNRLWTRLFPGARDIEGRKIHLNGSDWTIAGVMPAGLEHVGGEFRSTLHGESVDLWWPIEEDPSKNRRFFHFYNVIGRMKPGVTFEQASQDLLRVSDDLARRYPDANRDFRAKVRPLRDEIIGASAQTVLLLLGAACLVLLIACVNVASLSLARALARRQELAIRASLGAGALRLFRLSFLECLMVAATGGLLGLGFGFAAVPALIRMMPADFPRLHVIALDPIVFVFTAGITIITALIFGIVPSLAASRIQLAPALRDGARGSTGGAIHLRSGLVVAEVALASALLVGAGLLLRSFVEVQRASHGFDGGNVLTFALALPGPEYRDGGKVAAFFAELNTRLGNLPGVESAGATVALPWTGHDENSGFDIVGRKTEGRSPTARYLAATPGYFKALKIPLLRGRFLNDADTPLSPPVVLINDALARKYFAGTDPIGQKLDLWGAQRTIAGVIADIKDTPSSLAAEPSFYWPHSQRPFNLMTYAVKMRNGDPLQILEPVRAELRAMNPELAMAEVRTMENVMSAAQAQRRFAMVLVVAFSIGALLLAGIGAYGVLAYVVEQRRRELGIRIALGARESEVIKLVLGQGLRLTVAGLLIGGACAWFLTRLLQGFLYGVSQHDAQTYGAVIVITLCMSIAAAIIPARRASAINPSESLKTS